MISSDEKKILTLIKILPIFIIIFSLFFTYIIISNNNEKFELEIEKLKIDSLNTKKEIIRNEVQRVYEFVKNEEKITIEILRDNIKQRVYEAHTIAT